MLGFGALGELALGELPMGQATPAVADAPAFVRRGAPRVDRYYLPPGKYTKQRKQKAVDAVETLYAEAREIIPHHLQTGLIPPAITLRARASVALPPPAAIDFEALAGSLETIRVLLAAIKSQRDAQHAAIEAKRQRRIREERAVGALMVSVLDQLDIEDARIAEAWRKPLPKPPAKKKRRVLRVLRNEKGEVVGLYSGEGDE